MVIDRLGIETQAETKHDLARAIVESAGHAWRQDFESAGGTVTLRGLAAVLEAVTAMVPEEGFRPGFHVVTSLPVTGSPRSMLLVEDEWDDTSPFATAYRLYYSDARGSLRVIGSLKLGQRDMAAAEGRKTRPSIPSAFDRLGDEFFSLGQESDYYNRMLGLGDAGHHILNALRDMALNEDVYAQASSEPALKSSVMQSVPRSMMVEQFRRLARGGARLTDYTLAFRWVGHRSAPPVQIELRVTPHSVPPTNVHAIIGRNGAGKTRLLQAISHAAVQGSTYSDQYIESASWHESTSSGQVQVHPFTTLVHSSFSAFDEIEPPPAETHVIPFTSIGLPLNQSAPYGTVAAIRQMLSKSLEVCLHGERRRRWHGAVRTLESDPIFAEAGLSTMASDSVEPTSALAESREHILEVFSSMSSGHKLALLAITQLVEKVEERALVLIDEPESHLHPPLLASFLRAVADLLTDRNGVAIVATHSPVVLQEIPRKCVTVLRRSGSRQAVDHPRIETFGENISTLTRDVFGLEVTRSGFHQRILDEIDGETTFEDLEDSFDGQLGSEARAVALAAIANRDADW
ncbi:AAA family ATPase [Promicromonospora sp. NPDC019610]|uniref:AAA family ATPase n=1 Tax=Promicromonospora sp. NPDC019610 TaxID=3364405 RepID=UPI0037888139